jgi:hypothetical protein
VEDPEKDALRLEHLQSCLVHKVMWLPIPIAAQPLRMTLGPPILPPPQPPTIAPAMLQQEDAALWLADPRHLAERRYGRREGTQRESIHHGIEAPIGKGQVLPVHHLQRHVSPKGIGPFAGDGDHRWTQIHSRQLAGRGVVA